MDVHLSSLLSEFPLFLRQRKEHRIQQDILPGLPLHAGCIRPVLTHTLYAVLFVKTHSSTIFRPYQGFEVLPASTSFSSVMSVFVISTTVG